MTAHRHWRVLFPEANSSIYVQLTEVEFRQTVGVPETPTGGTAYASSVYGASYAASRAFDGNITTAWSTAGDQAINSWIAYDYGAGNEKDILEVAVRCDNGTSYAPKSIQIEYSDDGAEWHFYGWYGNQTGWTAREERLFLTYEPENQPTRFTQIQGYVVESSNKSVRFTQIQGYVVVLPVQPARFTQVENYVVALPRPVPLPLSLVPEIPVVETWSWLTSVNIKDNGKEQRSSLREIPRKRLKFDFVILGDFSRREIFDILWKYQGQEFLYPHYHLSTLVEPAPLGSTSLVFDPAFTDVRDGEQLAIYDSHTETTRYVSVDVVTPTGADLVEPLEFDVGPACLVCSVSTFYLPSSYGLTMDMVSGSSQITLEATESRPLQRTDGSGLLTYYDGYLVLDKRPMNGVEEGYDKNVNWVDNETGHPLPMTKWRPAFSSGKRSYLFDRREGMDYWRAFTDQVRGRFKSFIMATFFDDLPLTEVPALGATELVTSNIQADEYLYTRVYRYIRIERVDGSVIFRRVVDKKLIYDANGDPVALRLTLNASIGSAAGNNQIKMVSFAPLTRLDSDDVSLSHGDIDTTISFATRTINE